MKETDRIAKKEKKQFRESFKDRKYQKCSLSFWMMKKGLAFGICWWHTHSQTHSYSLSNSQTHTHTHTHTLTLPPSLSLSNTNLQQAEKKALDLKASGLLQSSKD